MIKLRNNKVIREVAAITYKGNKKRNLLTIFAIILTTFLIAVVIVIGSGYYDSVAKRQLYMNGMDYELELTEPRDEQIEKVLAMENVDYVGLAIKCGILSSYQDIMLAKTRLYWIDEVCWQRQTIPALESYTGEYPQAENEIMLSSMTLRAMGIIEPKIGMELPLSYTTLEEDSDGAVIEMNFRLCGWYTDYTTMGQGYVSREFQQKSGVKQTDITQGSLKISLKNPLYSEAEIISMMDALELVERQDIIGDYNTIETFMKTTMMLAVLLLMIFFSGYLFIFNTMYISILKDIRYYGQLKTLGMTSVQMRRVVYWQALVNAAIGIPIGIAASAVAAKVVVPEIIVLLNSSSSDIIAGQASGGIFVLAAVFSLVVNMISSRKPARMVGDCSPIEAMRYGPKPGKQKEKKREAAGVLAMAKQNMFRDKKQAAVILISFIIALSLFLVVNVIIRQRDGRRMLSERRDNDLMLRDETTILTREGAITEEMIAEIRAIPGVKQVRKVMSAKLVIPYQPEVYEEYFQTLYQSIDSPGNYEEDMKEYQQNPYNNYFLTRLTIVDTAGFEYLNNYLSNDLDQELFERGEIAIATTIVDFPEKSDYGMTGKTVHFSLPEGIDPDETYQIKIAGVLPDPRLDPAYFAWGYTPKLLVSERYAEKLLGKTYTESLDVVYENEYSQETEELVKAVFADENKVSYDSKLEQYEQMKPTELQIKVLGGSICILIAVLAVLNYINMIASSIQNRAREFATLESIGMTATMICKMLQLEGIGYGVISILFSLAAGLPLSYLVFSNTNIYGVSYSIPWISNLLLFMAVMAVCMVTPVIIYKRTQTDSIIERLRDVEG